MHKPKKKLYVVDTESGADNLVVSQCPSHLSPECWNATVHEYVMHVYLEWMKDISLCVGYITLMP